MHYGYPQCDKAVDPSHNYDQIDQRSTMILLQLLILLT
jgi:hypothetical protein